MIKNEKISNFINNTIVILSTIGFLSLILRLYYFPWEIPITEDGLFYFRYAIDTSILGHFPSTPLINNGWSLFVSIFFSIFHSNNLLDYMTLQRLLSVSISVLTIIPVYLLVRRFFEHKYALLGVFLFAFEPRTIQNSLQGISEPLYILLVTLTLFFFLSARKEIVYLSFSTAALATQVRYEGIVLFFLISIMYFVRYRKEKKEMAKYTIALCIFVLTLLPMSYARIITMGNDGIIDGITSGGVVYGIEATSNQENKIVGIFSYVLTGFQALIKFLGWVMIPYFVFFVPLGAFLILKKRNSNNFTMIAAIIVLSIPALYAYSRGIQETRYLYVLHPIFCVLSIFAIKFLQEKIKKVLLIIVFGVIISSALFLTIKSTDYEHEREAYQISKKIVDMTYVINDFYPETAYVRVSGLEKEFPTVINGEELGPKLLPIEGFSTVREFIEANEYLKIDHIVVDDKNNRPQFLKDVFNNEEKYAFLIKKFDSSEYGYNYHVKIFEIDFDKFEMNSKKKIIPP